MSIKLCADCAWFQPSPNTDGLVNYDKCTSPEFVKLDLVRGNHKVRYCQELRMPVAECGPEGRGFTYNPGSPVEPGVDEHEL